MTAGLTAYLDLATAEEHVFRKGDFYVIEPGAVYAQKSAPGTQILFIKVSPGNYKVPVDLLLSGVGIAEASYAFLELDAL